MHFFDAHNHLNDELFADNWQEVARRAKVAGLVGMVVNGSDVTNSRRAVELAEQVDIAYAAVGIHPEALPLKDDLAKQIKELSELAGKSNKIVAIGELGLDYTLEAGDRSREADKKQQIELLEPQLDLARRLGLPVVLHVRDLPGRDECFNDTLRLLDNFSGLTGQFHCWTGNIDQMEEVVERGYYVSFSGILTYNSAGQIPEVAKRVPKDRLLVETDGPYLVPEPRRTTMRKEGLRNSERLCLPEYVTMTTEKLAELRQESIAGMAEITVHNAEQLFSINGS